MFPLYMSCQIALLCCLIVTLITSILDLDAFMNRFNMLCQMFLVASLIVTLIASILEAFMFRLGMVP